MASKSKRRRRVFRASCILAALIIAGSSFAWFTSKDEVTNRLTASSDYGVSIVESFIPPKNMVPGQIVNKDVYAVNTGNIGAFVKESVSGVLNYTYEKKVAAAPTGDADNDKDYVELNEGIVRAIDGATTNEAGGFLAYTTAAGVTAGVTVNSARTGDTADGEWETPNGPGEVAEPRWTPTTTGVYIFRRGITNAKEDWDPTIPAGTNATNDAKAPKYTYAGYYYVAETDKYYKIVIGDDEFRAEEESVDSASGTANYVFDISVDEDELGANIVVDKATGKISGNVPVQYVKDKKVVNAVPTLTYHAQGGNGSDDVAYLEATYLDSDGASVSLQQKKDALDAAKAAEKTAYDEYLAALSDAAIKENEYERILGDYCTAKSAYEQAKADYDYAKALEDATNAIYNAAEVRANAEKALEEKENLMNQAFNKMMNEVHRLNTDPGNSADNKNTQFADIYAGTQTEKNLKSDDCNISFKTIFGTTERSIADATGAEAGTLDKILKEGAWGTTGNTQLLPTILDYRTKMYDKWEEIKTQTGKLEAAMKAFYTGDTALSPTRTDGKSDPAEAETLKENVLTEKAKLATLLDEYKTLYATLHQKAALNTATTTPGTAASDFLTNLESHADDFETNETAWETRLSKLQEAIKRTAAADPGLEKLIEAYQEAWNAYKNERNNGIDDADKRWAQAVADYNTAVGNAQSDYFDAIYTNQILKDEAGNYAKNDYKGLVSPSTNSEDRGYIDGYSDATAYNSTTMDVTRYLTNNNDKINEEYGSEKKVASSETGKADPKFGSDFVNTDGTLKDAGKELWKTIGGTRGADSGAYGYEGAALPTKGTTTSAKYTQSTTSAPTAGTYTYTEAYNASTILPEVTSANAANYDKATNGTAIKGDETVDDSFAEFNIKTGGTASSPTAQTLKALKTAMDTKKGDLGDSESTGKPYNDYVSTQETLNNAEAEYERKQAATASAQQAYDKGAQNEDSFIKINIYLDDKDENLEWTSYLYDGESTENPDHVADFYYDYILAPGATSHKLIDAVQISPETSSKDYKELTFDLNVKLDSAQITYADDQKTISTAAVEAHDGFAVKPATPIASETAKLNWGEREDETEHLYFMGNTRVEPTEIKDDGSSVTLPVGATGDDRPEKVFTYKFSDGTDTYYGANKSGEFYKVDNATTPTYVEATPVVVEDVTPETMHFLGTNKVKDSDFEELGEKIKNVDIEGNTEINYAYKITVGGKTYAGADKNDGTKYYAYTPSGTEGTPGTLDASDSLTLKL